MSMTVMVHSNCRPFLAIVVLNESGKLVSLDEEEDRGDGRRETGNKNEIIVERQSRRPTCDALEKR